MITIIAGSRKVCKYSEVLDAVKNSGIEITYIISGGASGADRLGEIYGIKNKIPYVVMKADWELDGRSAGYIRNGSMAEEAEALIALWDGESKGTKHMIDIAKEMELQVYVHKVNTGG